MPAPKELTLDEKIAILREYLVYDLRNVRNMVSFVYEYPSVLTDPQVAESIVPDPACYHTAVVMAVVVGRIPNAFLAFKGLAGQEAYCGPGQ
jgi:hypothetical protein